jgi:hypothetical protein
LDGWGLLAVFFVFYYLWVEMNENHSQIWKMLSSKRFLAIFSCALFLFVFAFPVLKAEHHCSHSDRCATCAVIQAIQDTLDSSDLGTVLPVVVMLAFSLVRKVVFPGKFFSKLTLVGLKVRLDN